MCVCVCLLHGLVFSYRFFFHLQDEMVLVLVDGFVKVFFFFHYCPRPIQIISTMETHSLAHS
jgi:hypothetical protein